MSMNSLATIAVVGLSDCSLQLVRRSPKLARRICRRVGKLPNLNGEGQVRFYVPLVLRGLMVTLHFRSLLER